MKTRDGFPMEALLIRPTSFDPAKKYPVYQFLYGGPHAQQVRNEWRGQFMLFNQLIAAFKGCSPLKLPAEYYDTPNGGWNNINFNWKLR